MKALILVFIALLASNLYAKKPDPCVSDSSGLVTCAARIFTPHTLAELQDAVNTARKLGKKIRPFGGLHSQIDDVAVGSDNFLIDMNGLDKFLDFDLHKKRVKVQGGVALYNLTRELAKIGLELIGQPGAYEITPGGMAANGVHQSGFNFGTSGSVCDSIVEIQILDGNGNLQTISNKSHPEWFPAARVSLGVLGPIYSVTFQCYPATKRELFAEVIPVEHLLPRLNALLANNNNFQFQMDPDPANKIALLQTFNITDAPVTNNSTSNFARYLANSEDAGELSVITDPLTPVSAYPAINRAIITGAAVQGAVEFFYKSVSFFHDNVVSRARIAEISVEAKFIRQAINTLYKEVQKSFNEGFRFIFTTEVRFNSDKHFSYLGPTNRPSWLLGLIIIFPDNSPQATDLLRRFSTALLKFNGRPVWGNNPAFLTVKETRRLYGRENLAAFNAVRHIFDPQNIFFTPYFRQRLGA